MIYLTLFLTFLQFGFFGFGGGYGMLSQIQREVVFRHHWMTSGEFTDIVAISQVTPGPIGINAATYCGYTAVSNAGGDATDCFLGSVIATFGIILPSLILMILIAAFFMKFKDHPIVQSIFTSLRPVVVGIILAAVLMLCNKETFSTPDNPWQFCLSIALFIVSFIALKMRKVTIPQMLLLAASAGLLLF